MDDGELDDLKKRIQAMQCGAVEGKIGIREWRRLREFPREHWKWCHQELREPSYPFHHQLRSRAVRVTNLSSLAQLNHYLYSLLRYSR